MTQPRTQRRLTALTVDALEDRLTLSSTTLITGLYSNLLHRAPVQADLAYWVPQLDSGMPASPVAAQIVASPEYQRDFIRSSYQLFLNHNPSNSAMSYWLTETLFLGMSAPQAEGLILASPEFVQAHPGDTNTWINAVYEQVLGRPGDTAGLTFWDGALQGGAANFDVAFAIVNSAEASSRVVTDAYHQLLGRNAEPAALAYWDTVATQPQGAALVLSGIAGSAEYVNRASAGGSTGSGGGAGTGPFYSEPYCADPFQFADLGGGGSGSTGSGGSGGSGGSAGSGGSGGSGGGSGGSGGGSGGSD